MNNDAHALQRVDIRAADITTLALDRVSRDQLRDLCLPAERAAALLMQTLAEDLPGCPSLERMVFAMRGDAVETAFREALKQALPT